MWKLALKKQRTKSPSRCTLAVFIVTTIACFVLGVSPLLKPLVAPLGVAAELLTTHLVNQLFPDQPHRLWSLANYHFSHGHDRKTIKLCEELLGKYLDEFDGTQIRQTYAILGLAYGRSGEKEKELQVYERMMVSDPTYAHFLKGVALDALDKFHESGEEFVLALETESVTLPLDEMARQVIQAALGKDRRKNSREFRGHL